jgi:hypothetical protein
VVGEAGALPRRTVRGHYCALDKQVALLQITYPRSCKTQPNYRHVKKKFKAVLSSSDSCVRTLITIMIRNAAEATNVELADPL